MEAGSFSRSASASPPRFRDVDGAFGIPVQQGIGKRDDLGADFRKDCLQIGEEGLVGRIIGPESEDSARMQVLREASQAFPRIESAVAAVEQLARQ